jgi:hypothetical protein
VKLDATLQNFTDVSLRSPTQLTSQLEHPSASRLPTHQIPKSVDTHVPIENDLIRRLAQPEPTSVSHSSDLKMTITDSIGVERPDHAKSAEAGTTSKWECI